VTARPESWSQPPDATFVALATLAAGLAFLGAWLLLHHGFYGHNRIIDTPIYQAYGDAMVDGKVPYRDFDLEYPPAALPVFVLPSVAAGKGKLDGYERSFEGLMAACGFVLVALVALTLLALRAPPGRLLAALAFTAFAPLALGSVVLSRFDLWPTALALGALAALVSGRERLGLGVLGVGVAAKLWPALLLPPALAFVWRRRGRREALICAAIFLAVLAALFGPFLVLAPDGVWSSLTRQADRPLQIESLGAALLIAAHHLFGADVMVRSSSGSQNLSGGAADAIAAAQTVVQILLVVGVWVWFARGPAERERLVQAAAALVAIFVAFGKVLSPQFLIWLIPLVPLVRGRRGLAASGVLAAALVLTQIEFPYRYWGLVALDELPSWILLGRDFVLAALAAVLIVPARQT
jgi:Glycosyltransferase family 87